MPNDSSDPANAAMPLDQHLIRERLEKYLSLSKILASDAALAGR
jgi:hypothetical protein